MNAVSVIIPAYNASAYLAETIESALAQTSPPLEIIVVDDGSTDDTAAIAKSFGSPVRVFQQVNQGESVARNRGISESRGNAFYFLDADDVLDPRALATMTAALVGRPRGVALMGMATFRGDIAHVTRTIPPAAAAFLPEILQTNFGPPICWLFPASMVKSVGGFNVKMRWSEDWEFCGRVGCAGAELVPVDFVGAFQRQHDRSQVATSKLASVRLGHAEVKKSLCRAVLASRELCAAHGEAMFWSGWVSLVRARAANVKWNKLRELSAELRALAVHGPVALRESRTARIVRTLGVRTAFYLSRWREPSLPLEVQQ